MKKVYIYSYKTKQSFEAAEMISARLAENGLEVSDALTPDTDMIIVFGGDGTFLHALKDCDYPEIPVLGVNTGHLGFFEEFTPKDSDAIVRACTEEAFMLQPYKLLKMELKAYGIKKEYFAFNDICIRQIGAGVSHLKVSVGDNFVERFSGDGVVVASSAGSTGYNYSLKGAIVDPRLEVLQLTPIAPLNNAAFRSFTTGLLFPAGQTICVEPMTDEDDALGIYTDGSTVMEGRFTSLKITLSSKTINVVRDKDYDFWHKVQDKFL